METQRRFDLRFVSHEEGQPSRHDSWHDTKESAAARMSQLGDCEVVLMDEEMGEHWHWRGGWISEREVSK